MMTTPAIGEYQIGWICALPIEAAAAQEMLDESFGTLEEQDNADTNIYTLGRIGKHYVVIACLGGQYGTTSATTVANNMMRTLSKSLRVGLMVGIGGGIPSATDDIRLGDIVISYPTDTCGGVLQHDLGKVGEDGKITRTAAVNQMRAAAYREDPLYPSYIQRVYEHPSHVATCDGCLAEWEVERDQRDDNEPQLHYGVIVSGNIIIKHGEIREQLRKKPVAAICGISCFIL
ncbi:nucleoside phosphorylase domain-containing protein [Aspergillus leporis]|uniref:Nucleoside phosphorylase domain-containing protein n=1 Tax=Aspergillus leporis TaxID=41062 RepID=A0A5N5WPX9_9EURO|nr:nucleoside phosphorylase domain-containing protein [Aspergillus leporis]